jgi:glucose/arabinose dehydrogenase
MSRASMIIFRSAALILAAAAGFAGPGRAATVPTGFTDSLVVSGLTNPTAMALAPDGRLFVTEKGGRLRVIKDNALLSAPFLTVTVNQEGERGLLGVTFDPGFGSNGFVYVYYTATSPAIHNRVSRFTANGDVAVPGSEVVIFELNNLSGATNHNGGAIHFGPDGKLYIAAGENANPSNAQSFGNLLGKILRINKDGSIPGDNPFLTVTSGQNRAIWSLGLRNPYTFTFEPGTGRMFINDVGQDSWEEIDDGIAGSNYGWPTTEGPTSNSAFRSPLLWYNHVAGATGGCAITGGAFYAPATQQFPEDYDGDYFFADFCSGWIRRFDPAHGTNTAFLAGADSPVDLLVIPDGSLLYLSFGDGAVRKVQFPAGIGTPTDPCVANATTLCLNDGRFAVSATWRTSAGQQGTGRAVSLTADTGYFWFFDQANVEMVVKVLDACGVNSRFWVFAGGLTDVQVDWTVTDTHTGARRTYRNTQGTPLRPVQDTTAFATCGS